MTTDRNCVPSPLCGDGSVRVPVRRRLELVPILAPKLDMYGTNWSCQHNLAKWTCARVLFVPGAEFRWGLKLSQVCTSIDELHQRSRGSGSTDPSSAMLSPARLVVAPEATLVAFQTPCYERWWVIWLSSRMKPGIRCTTEPRHMGKGTRGWSKQEASWPATHSTVSARRSTHTVSPRTGGHGRDLLRPEGSPYRASTLPNCQSVRDTPKPHR